MSVQIRKQSEQAGQAAPGTQASPARPYYSKVLSAAETMQMLGKLNAAVLQRAAHPSVKVYKIDGEGEAMVTAFPNREFRVELFKGKCPC